MTSAFRAVPYAFAVSAALLFAGCGGGGTGETFDPGGVSPAGTASLTGQVVEVDGETTSLGGIQLELLETGKTVTTGFDGSFDFGKEPLGSLGGANIVSRRERMAGVQADAGNAWTFHGVDEFAKTIEGGRDVASLTGGIFEEQAGPAVVAGERTFQ